MPTIDSYHASRAPFVADRDSITSDSGHVIDWANVSSAYKDAVTGKKRIPAGTAMGSLLGGGKLSPRVVTTNPAVCLLATDASEGSKTDSRSGYGVIKGGVIYENLLPDATGGPPPTLPSAIKTELATAGVSTGFAWVTYADSSAA